MIKVFSGYTLLSIILFLIALLVVYAFLPGTVGILFYDDGSHLYDISRNSFFYGSLIIFLFIQLLFYLFITAVVNKKFSSSGGAALSVWFRGMVLAINFFLILMIIFTGLANNADDYTYSSILFIAYAGPAIIFIWLLLFPVFFKRYRRTR